MGEPQGLGLGAGSPRCLRMESASCSLSGACSLACEPRTDVDGLRVLLEEDRRDPHWYSEEKLTARPACLL